MESTTDTYVLVELAGTTYAVHSAQVQHIEMVEQVTLVPNAHRAIDGVVFSRGQVIPALNLRVRFGFPRQERTLRTRIIFVHVQQRVVGLVVDSAREFRKIAPGEIRPIESTLTGVARNYLTGLATMKDRLILILDLEAVLNLEQDAALADSISNLVSTTGAPDATAAATTS